MVGAELGEGGTDARMIGARCNRVVDHDVQASVTGIPGNASRLLQIEGSAAHTNSKPGTNATALRIEVFCRAPGLEEHIVK